MSNYEWWKQYENVAEALLEAGIPGAADDILTLVDGLKCWERDGKELRRRAEAAEDALAVARKALTNVGHVLENIADPYNETQWQMKKWAKEALVTVRAALSISDTPGKEDDG